MRKMMERKFSAIFRTELKNYCNLFNIPVHINLLPDTIRSGKKPYDSYAVLNGNFVALEFKSYDSLSIPIDVLKEHQVKKLKEVKNAGGSAYYIILLTRYDCVLCVSVKVMEELVKEWENDFALKSIKCEEIFEIVKRDYRKVVFTLKRHKVQGKTMWGFKKFVRLFA